MDVSKELDMAPLAQWPLAVLFQIWLITDSSVTCQTTDITWLDERMRTQNQAQLNSQQSSCSRPNMDTSWLWKQTRWWRPQCQISKQFSRRQWVTSQWAKTWSHCNTSNTLVSDLGPHMKVNTSWTMSLNICFGLVCCLFSFIRINGSLVSSSDNTSRASLHVYYTILYPDTIHVRNSCNWVLIQ